jgi:DNA-binding MarR family transcriptional regulator
MPDRTETMHKPESTQGQKTAGVRKAGRPINSLGWDDIGYLCEGLAFAGRPLRQATERVTLQHDLGPRGAWILNLISNGLIHPLELSNVFNVGRSLITAELARLTEAGLITSRSGELDRRRSDLALTPAGIMACKQIRHDMSEIIHTNLARYSMDEFLLFARMLRDVRGGKGDS